MMVELSEKVAAEMTNSGLLNTAAVAVIGAAASVIFSQFKLFCERKAQRRALAYALAAELGALQARYQESIGEDWTYGFEEPRFHYFTVFDSNAVRIGELKKEHAGEVARLYIKAKGHFEDAINWAKWEKSTWSEAEKHRFKTLLERDKKELLEKVPVLCNQLRSY